MINKEKLKSIIEDYKHFFPVHWINEQYKWVAIKVFQDNWDINADDFYEMFKKATEKADNLLSSRNSFPRGMILEFANADATATREMFKLLFDESIDLGKRIEDFKLKSEELRVKYGNGKWKSHFQDNNSISTYLWLRFPDKYYIYKFTLYLNMANELESDHIPKSDGTAKSLLEGFKLYDEIAEFLSSDTELLQMFSDSITPACYPDNNLRTLTIDLGFWFTKYRPGDLQEEWFPNNYTPGLSVEDWVALLNDESVFTISSLQIMKRMKDYGGQATCTQLALKYGESKNFYNKGSSALAKRVYDKTHCVLPPERDSENARWWPILYVGKYARDSETGSYIWKLREELKEALDQIDMESVMLYKEKPSVWKISHGSISGENRVIFENKHIVVVHGTTKAKATSKVSQGESFTKQIKKGDFFYLCYGNSIQLLGEFTSDEAVLNPELEDGWYERTYRIIKKSKDYSSYKGIQKWWSPNDNSTCIKVEKKDYALFESAILNPYFDISIQDLLGDIDLEESKDIEEMSNMFSKNTILYGPPGTGKTFYTMIYAVAIIENEDISEIKKEAQDDYDAVKSRYDEYYENGRIAFTTFHQSYGYEEFIEGIRPTAEDGFVSYSVKSGVFKEFCERNKGRDSFDDAWAFIVEQAKRNGNKYTFTRNSGNQFEAIYNEEKDKFVLLFSGGSSHDITKKAVQEMIEVGEVWRENPADYPEGNKALYENRWAVALEIKKLLKAGTPAVFIIDEINRGNISKVFGELITLIEDTKRLGEKEAAKIILPYSKTEFSVPSNVYLLGTMNTADRSIAMMDTALRRRFHFIEMLPDEEVLKAAGVGYIQDGDQTLNVAEMLRIINKRIAYLYDREHTIGHAFFLKLVKNPSLKTLSVIFKENVIPLLQEYFYEDYGKIQLVLGDNGKTDEKYIFIKGDEDDSFFNGDADLDNGRIMYSIQEEAFDLIESYKQIGKGL